MNHRAKNVYSRLFLSSITLNLSLERDLRRAMCSMAHAIQQSYKHTHTYTHFRTIRREILYYRSVSHSFCFLILSVSNRLFDILFVNIVLSTNTQFVHDTKHCGLSQATNSVMELHKQFTLD